MPSFLVRGPKRFLTVRVANAELHRLWLPICVNSARNAGRAREDFCGISFSALDARIRISHVDRRGSVLRWLTAGHVLVAASESLALTVGRVNVTGMQAGGGRDQVMFVSAERAIPVEAEIMGE